MTEKLNVCSLIYIPAEESHPCTAPAFYISGTFQQQTFNRLLSSKPRVGPTLPMVTNKLQLSFFGSRFFIVPHRPITLTTNYFFSLSKALRFKIYSDKVLQDLRSRKYFNAAHIHF